LDHFNFLLYGVGGGGRRGRVMVMASVYYQDGPIRVKMNVRKVITA